MDQGPADDAAAAPEHPPGHKPFSRRHIYTLIAPIIVLIVANNIGNALAPELLVSNPLLLIALSAPNRNLILVSHEVPIALFFVVGFVRLMLPDVFFYTLGEHYGQKSIAWMEHRTPTFGKLMRQLESAFSVASWPLVVIMPNNPVCLLAGAAHMRKRVFWTLNVVGTVGRLVIMYAIGEAFQGLIDDIIGWIARYRLPLVAATIAIVAFTSLREWRAGTSEIQQLIELEEELEVIEHLDEAGTTEGSIEP